MITFLPAFTTNRRCTSFVFMMTKFLTPKTVKRIRYVEFYLDISVENFDFFGTIGVLKVSTKVFVSMCLPSFLIIILLTDVIPCNFRFSFISSSETPFIVGSFMMPLEEFSVR